jgi:hypothetical protein
VYIKATIKKILNEGRKNMLTGLLIIGGIILLEGTCITIGVLISK